MTRLAVIASLAALALGLGACSSSNNPLVQAKLANQDADMCQSGSGAPTGLAALGSPQGAYAECMQERYASRPMGFSEGGRFAPGSNPASLADIGH